MSVNIISAAEAEHLLSHFHERLGNLIGFLDPILHTLEYLRSTSSVLTSAVLAASAGFVRPDIKATLLGHFQTLMNRAFQDEVCDTAMVQSLLIAVFWKEVTDVSAWRKVGMALRMAYQLRWHVRRTSELPTDEEAARIILVSLAVFEALGIY